MSKPIQDIEAASRALFLRKKDFHLLGTAHFWSNFLAQADKIDGRFEELQDYWKNGIILSSLPILAYPFLQQTHLLVLLLSGLALLISTCLYLYFRPSNTSILFSEAVAPMINLVANEVEREELIEAKIDLAILKKRKHLIRNKKVSSSLDPWFVGNAKLKNGIKLGWLMNDSRKEAIDSRSSLAMKSISSINTTLLLPKKAFAIEEANKLNSETFSAVPSQDNAKRKVSFFETEKFFRLKAEIEIELNKQNINCYNYDHTLNSLGILYSHVKKKGTDSVQPFKSSENEPPLGQIKRIANFKF